MKARQWSLLGFGIAFITSGALAASGAVRNPPSTVKFQWGDFTLSPRIAAKVSSNQKLNYVLSIEGTGIPIFGPAMSTGWERGAKAGGANAQVIGPITTDIPTQISQITSLLQANQIDCLGFEAHSPGPYVGVINKAMSEGVPVFGINADSPNSHRISFFALNEEKAGELAGRLTGQIIKSRHLKITKAALESGAPEGPYAIKRMTGFMKGLHSVVPSITFANSITTAVKTLYDFPTVYSTTRAYITGHPDVQLIFHTDQGVETVGKVIKDLKLTGKVWAVGFNTSPTILDEIVHDQILVTIGQQWNKQAEAGANACTQFIHNGTVPPSFVPTTPIPVTGANAAALKKTVSVGGA
jgi:ribose transport system substrate-binding protein